MNQVYRSLFFSAAERYATIVLFFISTAIMSRLLLPSEFGIYALLSALTAVAGASFQEFGGANYLIQKADLTAETIRTAFTITSGLSVVVAGALCAARGLAADFFVQPGLHDGMAVVAFEFLLCPLSVTLSALLRRDLNFRLLAVSTFAANATNAVATIVLALAHFSFMAPVWASLLANLLFCGILVSARGSLAIFRPCLKAAREILNFGAYSSAVVIINVFYQAAPQLILGRMLDFHAVGLFGRATSVTQVFDRLVLQAVQPVVMPALFTQVRAGGDLKSIYLQAIGLITAVQWPFLIVLALVAEPLVTLWLGPTWTPIVPLVRCLCVASLALFGACLTYPILVACGRVRDTLTSSLVSLPPSLLVMVLASFGGLQAVAASMLITLPFQAAVAIVFVARQLAFGPADLLRAVWKSVIVAAAAAAGPAAVLVLHHVGSGSAALGLPALFEAGTTAILGWYVAIRASEHPLDAHIRAVADRLLPFARRRTDPTGQTSA